MKKPTLPRAPQRVTTAKRNRKVDISWESLQNVIDLVRAEGVADLRTVEIETRNDYDGDTTVQACWNQVTEITLNDADWQLVQSEYAAALAQYERDLAAYETWVAAEERRKDLETLNALLVRYPEAANRAANA